MSKGNNHAKARNTGTAGSRFRPYTKATSQGAKYFSQNGEDGIIREIFNRIGITNSFFVEFGVGEGTENNTACLLFQNWCGLWVDANPQPRKQARSFIKSGRLQFHSGIVTRDNVNEILKQMKVPSDPDLLSIDMDLNTYHIWQAMEVIRPRAVVVEYNANFPPSVEWIADYNPPQFWDHTSYFGASLKSYEILGTRLGYCLVGCDFMGVNAFFIRHDLCSGKFISPYTSEMHYEPPRFGTAGFGHVIRLA